MTGKDPDKYKDKVILAPMVKIGTLPTRLLALEYGADLVYTEEIIDWRILKCKRFVNEMFGTIEYVDQSDSSVVFSTCPAEKDRVIFQMGTSDADRALQVLKLIQGDVAGVDINMGCPKEFSIKGGMGAALLRKPDKVKAILTTLVTNSKIPITCKIRVLKTLEETLALAEMIETCGVSALAVHGRNVNERPQHPNRNHFIKAIADKLTIPVIANGGSKEVKCYEDIERFRKAAGSSSVMLARAGGWNPSIFSKNGKEDVQEVIKKYLKLSVETNNAFPNSKYAIQYILRELQESPMGKRFLATQEMFELCDIWGLKDFYDAKSAEWDKYKATKRHLESSEEEYNPKKLKLDCDTLLEDDSVVKVPDCIFLRGHYQTNEQLPKSKLLKWAIKEFDKNPSYETELYDKKFRSVVTIGGKRFMTDTWEKNKRNAEQAAALACLISMKL